MTRLYHLFLFDDTIHNILVETVAGLWVAPVIGYAGAPHYFADKLPRALAGLGLAATPIHDAELSGGDFSTTQGYCALVVKQASVFSRSGWLALDCLDTSRSLFPAQAKLLDACLKVFRRPRMVFDSPEAVWDLARWMDTTLRVLNVRHEAACILKHTQARRIVHWTTKAGDIYLKAYREVAGEAALTDALWRVCPEHFAKSLALDCHHGRWLYRGVQGRVLTANDLTVSSAMRLGNVLAVLQQRLVKNAPPLELFAKRTMTGWHLDQVAVRCRELVIDHTLTDQNAVYAFSDRTLETIHDACRCLDDMPPSVLFGDLWLRNVVQSNDTFGLIDIERSYWGPPLLVLWRLVDYVRRVTSPDITSAIVSGYINAWSQSRYTSLFARAARHLKVTGSLYALSKRIHHGGLDLFGSCTCDQLVAAGISVDDMLLPLRFAADVTR